MNKEDFTFDNFLRILIWILLALMLAVVVHDRYYFHKCVYKKAVCEVALLKKAKKSCHCSCKCRHYVDSIAKPLQNRSSAEAANTNNIRQTVNVDSNSSSLRKMAEDASSLFSLMKDVDGLISANGLTFLISLIVALLIALVTERMGVLEKFRGDTTKEIKEEKERLNNFLNEQIEKKDRETKETIEKALENVNNKTKDRTTLLYNHLANYDMLLARVVSLFNIAITIGSVTRFMFLNPVANTEINMNFSEEIGTLCSRLSLLCDFIGDIFITSENKIDYLSKDEKNILFTYLLDAKVELKKSREMVKNNENLYNILGDCRRMIENIYDKIETVETPND